MSIESAKARMSQVATIYTSYMQKPNSVFNSMLQEKLGVTTTNNNTNSATNNTNNVNYVEELQNMMNQNGTAHTTGDFCIKCGISASEVNNNTFNNTNSTGVSNAILNQAAPYMDIINKVSQEQGMPANLIMGIIKAESDFNNNCVSYAGAKGLMQLMPETAAEVGVTDEFDSAQNIEGSVKYINKLIAKYDGDVKLALAAYNTGPGKIDRKGVTSSNSPEYLTVPQSIRDYADRVLRYAGYTI